MAINNQTSLTVMTYVRTAILSLLFLGTLLIGYTSYIQLGKNDLLRAEELFQTGEYQQTLQAIDELEGEIPGSNLNLMRAYTALAQEDAASSKMYLKQARLDLTRSTEDISDEIRLLEAYTAFKLNDLEDLQAIVKRAKSTDPMIRYLSALSYYDKGNFEEALQRLSAVPDMDLLSSWQKHTFAQLFRPTWRSIRIARCHLAAKQYKLARTVLTKETSMFERHELGETWFLVGLSHIWEAINSDTADVNSHYTLALSHFEKVQKDSVDFSEEKKQTISAIKSKAIEMIDANETDQLGTLTSILTGWNANQVVQDLTFPIFAAILKAIDTEEAIEIDRLTVLLDHLLANSEQRDVLANHAVERLNEAVNEGNVSKIIPLWKLASEFSSDPASLSDRLTQLTETTILSAIWEPSEPFEQIRHHLALWDIVERNAVKRHSFSEALIDLAGAIWIRDQPQDAKSLALMEIASTLPYLTERTSINNRAEKVLRVLFRESSVKNEVTRLPTLIEAGRLFGLTSTDFLTSAEIENQLADAQYLFQEGRYTDAQNGLSLLMKVYPDHVGGRRLLGLIEFSQRNLEKALPLLKSVVKPGRDILEPLAVCETLIGDKNLGQHLLKRLEKQKDLTEDNTRLLAYRLLFQGKTKIALDRFQKISEPDSSVWAARLYIAHQHENWAAVTEAFYQLDTAYQHDETLLIMAIKALGYQGQLGESERFVDALFNNSEKIQPEPLSANYEMLKQLHSQECNPHLLAIDLYHKVAPNPKKVLEHMDHVSELTVDLQKIRAESLFAVGRLEEARKEFLSLLNSDDQTEKDEIFSYLAEISTNLSENYDAHIWWRKAIQNDSSNHSNRRKASKAATLAGLWDQAVEYLEYLRKRGDLPDEEKVLLIRSLMGNRQYSELPPLLSSWLGENSTVALLPRLLMVAAVSNIKEEPYSQDLLDNLDMNNLSLKEKLALLAVYLNRADHKMTTSLVNELDAELQKSNEGLMLYHQWLDHRSMKKKALTTAQLIASSSKHNRQIDHYMMSNSPNSSWGERQLLLYRKGLENQPNSTTAKILTARGILYYASTRNRETNGQFGGFQGSLEEAKKILSKVLKEINDLAEPYYLMGKIQKFQGNLEEAVILLEKSEGLDPTFTPTSLALAQIYLERNELRLAQNLLDEKIKNHPYSSELWKLLATCYERQDSLLEAKNCYQVLVSLRPKDTKIYFSLGKLLLKLQNPEDAWKVLDSAVKLEPKNQESLELLLECLHNEALVRDNQEERLQEEKKLTYERLHLLNPSLASSLKERYQATTLR